MSKGVIGKGVTNKPHVPKLKLAPKRRKPLSLWNPLDYFQLLYWVFFFSQALRWYVEVFGEKNKLKNCKNWSERKQWWQNSPIKRSLWVQSLLLTISAPTTAIFLLGIEINIQSLAACIALSLILNIAYGIGYGSMNHIAYCVSVGVTFSIVFCITFETELSVAFAVALSASLGLSFSTIASSQQGSSLTIARDLAFIVLTCTLLGVAASIAEGRSNSFADGLVAVFIGTFLSGLAGTVAVLRPEEWLYSALAQSLPGSYTKNFSHTTSIPFPRLSNQIYLWLQYDWQQATRNINELIAHTRQFIPAVNAVNQALSKMDDDILILRISQLSTDLFDWKLIKYASCSLSDRFLEDFADNFFLMIPPLKRRLKARINTQVRTDTPSRAAAAGFWHLFNKDPDNAVKAFSNVRHLPHGQEMMQLSKCIALLNATEDLNDANLAANLIIPDSPLLHAGAWNAISCFRGIVDDAQIIYQSYSHSARSLALSRALGRIREIANNLDHIPQAAQLLVITTAVDWQKKLLSIAGDIGEASSANPVHNPYVAGDPVVGSLFAGRSEVIKQLEELWLMNSQIQSVVLYGHRRMGKTSILKNLSTYLGNNIQVVYINLLNLGTVSEGAGEVLITLTDAISDQLSIEPPEDEALLNLPYPTFRRFVQTINKTLKAEQGLIIALDEFEKIEELILANKLDADFLGYLRGLLQMSPKIAFAFAGLHTLEEMTEDYFNPLFASVLPIRIGFFTLPETRELLANPAEDFTLDYRPETLNEIYRLTAGQPYLTQLIGFQLVRHYNHQVFEQGTERTPIFTPQDLDTVIHHSDFFTKGRYYFTGVWNQAAQDAPGQQVVLKLLAEKEDGCTANSIRRKSDLSEADIIEALKTLTRHDVVTQSNDSWKIIVPLFRQWVLKNQ